MGSRPRSGSSSIHRARTPDDFHERLRERAAQRSASPATFRPDVSDACHSSCQSLSANLSFRDFKKVKRFIFRRLSLHTTMRTIHKSGVNSSSSLLLLPPTLPLSVVTVAVRTLRTGASLHSIDRRVAVAMSSCCIRHATHYRTSSDTCERAFFEYARNAAIATVSI